jgi:hypothetical protein
MKKSSFKFLINVKTTYKFLIRAVKKQALNMALAFYLGAPGMGSN